MPFQKWTERTLSSALNPCQKISEESNVPDEEEEERWKRWNKLRMLSDQKRYNQDTLTRIENSTIFFQFSVFD